MEKVLKCEDHEYRRNKIQGSYLLTQKMENNLQSRRDIEMTTYIMNEMRTKFSFIIDINPSVGSCHHGMARPLGCGWGSRPPDMEVSCEYIE